MERFRRDVYELFEELLEKQGYSRMYGQILAIIYLKEIPMTQEALERESDFSRSSINKAVNTLQNLGYIRKRKFGEGKKLVYYVEEGPKDILLSGFRSYISYLEKIHARFSKLFESTPKVEGLPLKKLKDFINQIPQITKLLNDALEKIDKLDFVFK
ncbi:MAG: MarR family transcriptional regulator [Candidatus Helarchaeota archaeon]